MFFMETLRIPSLCECDFQSGSEVEDIRATHRVQYRRPSSPTATRVRSASSGLQFFLFLNINSSRLFLNFPSLVEIIPKPLSISKNSLLCTFSCMKYTQFPITHPLPYPTHSHMVSFVPSWPCSFLPHTTTVPEAVRAAQ